MWNIFLSAIIYIFFSFLYVLHFNNSIHVNSYLNSKFQCWHELVLLHWNVPSNEYRSSMRVKIAKAGFRFVSYFSIPFEISEKAFINWTSFYARTFQLNHIFLAVKDRDWSSIRLALNWVTTCQWIN